MSPDTGRPTDEAGVDDALYRNLVAHTPKINAQLARYGVKFGLYKDGVFNERLFPFDAVPRIIEADAWSFLERGLIQRVDALNAYLRDLYGAKQIIADGVGPADFAFASSGYGNDEIIRWKLLIPGAAQAVQIGLKTGIYLRL